MTKTLYSIEAHQSCGNQKTQEKSRWIDAWFSLLLTQFQAKRRTCLLEQNDDVICITIPCVTMEHMGGLALVNVHHWVPRVNSDAFLGSCLQHFSYADAKRNDKDKRGILHLFGSYVENSRESREHQNHDSGPPGCVRLTFWIVSTWYTNLELSHGTDVGQVKIVDDFPINFETLRPHELAYSACFQGVSNSYTAEASAKQLLLTGIQLDIEMR